MTTSATKRKPRAKRLAPNPAVDFINALHHTGDFTGAPFALRPWQEDIIRKIFDEKGKTRYRTVFIGLGRKNGKTELAAAILLYLMFGTGRKAQRVFSASGDREQAALIYGAAAAMIRQSQALSDVSLVYDGYKRIEYSPLGSKYQALSSEHALKYGLRPSCILLDELWVFPNRDLYNALQTAFGATIDPFTLMISTAGWDRTSLCYEQWHYAEQVRDGLIDDPTFLPIIYAAPNDADWTSEETWRLAMPALGDFCQLDFIREQCRKAQQIPAYENTFRQLYLNQWTEQAERWLSTESWKECEVDFSPTELEGMACYSGLDMGIIGDMACYWMVFPMPDGKVRIIGHGWVPKDGKWRDEQRNKDRYLEWERQGYLTFTEGGNAPHKTADREHIKRDIIRWHQKFPVRQLNADKAYATDVLNDLFNLEAMPVKGISQGPVALNEACVLLEEMVIGKQIEHEGNPIMAWNIANASLIRTTTGLIYPNKSKSTERIDGLAALVDALAAYKDDPENHGPCPYDFRGIDFI